MRGKCYRYALESLFDLYAHLSTGMVTVTPSYCAFEFGNMSGPVGNLPLLGECPVLVHGFVVGDYGDLKDEKFGHAWLEGNGYVMDCGSVEKTHEFYDRDFYYEHWRINPQECQRYTIQQATRHVIATGADSGWSGASEGGHSASACEELAYAVRNH
jgi:hypothetical protein